MSIYVTMFIFEFIECIVYFAVEKELGMFSSATKKMSFLQTLKR